MVSIMYVHTYYRQCKSRQAKSNSDKGEFIRSGEDDTYSIPLQIPALEDLPHALLVIVSAEFILKTSLARAVEDPLRAVPVFLLVLYYSPSDLFSCPCSVLRAE